MQWEWSTTCHLLRTTLQTALLWPGHGAGSTLRLVYFFCYRSAASAPVRVSSTHTPCPLTTYYVLHAAYRVYSPPTTYCMLLTDLQLTDLLFPTYLLTTSLPALGTIAHYYCFLLRYPLITPMAIPRFQHFFHARPMLCRPHLEHSTMTR